VSAIAVRRISWSVIPVSFPPLGLVVGAGAGAGAGAAVVGEGPMTTVGFGGGGTVLAGAVITGLMVEVVGSVAGIGRVVTEPGGVRTDWFPLPPLVRAIPTPIATRSARETVPTMTTDLRSTKPPDASRLSLV
jgi:hypothetical protein